MCLGTRFVDQPFDVIIAEASRNDPCARLSPAGDQLVRFDGDGDAVVRIETTERQLSRDFAHGGFDDLAFVADLAFGHGSNSLLRI